jgi:hypothetical protein
VQRSIKSHREMYLFVPRWGDGLCALDFVTPEALHRRSGVTARFRLRNYFSNRSPASIQSALPPL